MNLHKKIFFTHSLNFLHHFQVKNYFEKNTLTKLLQTVRQSHQTELYFVLNAKKQKLFIRARSGHIDLAHVPCGVMALG